MSSQKFHKHFRELIEGGKIAQAHKEMLALRTRAGLHFSFFQQWAEILSSTGMAPLKLSLTAAMQVRLSPEEKVILDSFAAVDYWICQDLKRMHELSAYYLKTTKKERDTQDVVNAHNHLKICLRLFAYRLQNPEQYLRSASHALIAVGDSHALVPAGRTIAWNGRQVTVQARPIRGIKMYHLGEGSPPKFRSYFRETLKRLPDDADVLLAIGEIDCRPNEGIFAVAHKTPAGHLTELLTTTVHRFVAFAAEAFQNTKLRSITLLGIPAPRYDVNKRLPPNTTFEQFLNFIEQVNVAMRAEAHRVGWHFLDVHAATRMTSADLDAKYRLDEFHLSPNFYDDADDWRHAANPVPALDAPLLDASCPSPVLTVAQAMQQAIAHHQTGQLREAERLYRAVLKVQPDHGDANHNLGVLAVQARRPAMGLSYLKAALEGNPNLGQYWLSYIDALAQAGMLEAARQMLEQGRQRGLQGEPMQVLERRLAAASRVQAKED